MSRISPTFAVLTAPFVVASIVASVAFLSSRATSAAFDFEFTVDSTADTADASPDGVCDDGAGACTLRAAIEEANSADGDSLIGFNIPGDGPHTVSPQSSELVPVLNNVTIDGYTQPGISVNTLNSGDGTNAVLMIEIDGSALGGTANGITMIGTNSVLKGLAINNFGGSGVRLLNATANKVAGNFIGTDVTGTSAEPNGAGVTLDDAHDSTIGTTAATDTNLISGNGVGIVITGESEMNVVRRNLIGTAADGDSPLPNTSHGILMTGGADCNTIGGIPNPYRNVIAFNGGDGIALATDGGINNYVDPNFIHDNDGLGVDINDDGPTPNDDLDVDIGANELQNYPVLTSAQTGGGINITGALNSVPHLYYNIFFLANDECDPSGYGEGERFVGETTIIVGDSGERTFDVNFFGVDASPGDFITASASNPESTSEFSQCVPVTAGPAIIHGDVRCHGKVDATDGLGVLRYVAEMSKIAQTEPCPDLGNTVDGRIFGDILCNGGIDAVDALAVLRFVAGLPPLSAGPGCPAVGSLS